MNEVRTKKIKDDIDELKPSELLKKILDLKEDFNRIAYRAKPKRLYLPPKETNEICGWKWDYSFWKKFVTVEQFSSLVVEGIKSINVKIFDLTLQPCANEFKVE